jgi:hypothetical protein
MKRSRHHLATSTGPWGPLLRSSTLLVLLLAVGGGCGDGHHSRSSTPCCAVCGDGTCGGDETACNCPIDCGTEQVCTEIAPVCGNTTCDSGERHESCSADCPATCRQCSSNLRIYFKGTVFSEDHKCPAGTTRAQRVGDLIICSSCESSSDCHDQLQPACLTHCVPGCNLDSGECCPVEECSFD